MGSITDWFVKIWDAIQTNSVVQVVLFTLVIFLAMAIIGKVIGDY